MILRFLLLGGLAFFLFVLIMKIWTFAAKKKNFKNTVNFKQAQSILVKCSECGARVPQENAEKKGEQLFSCKDHTDEQD